jgi:tetratricopeptide (TPR) repeat protein
MRSRPCSKAALSGASLDAKTRAIIQNNIGMAYWNNKQFLLALPAYEQALKLDTNYADARYNLAFALLSQGRAKEAVPHFDVLIKNNPRDPLLRDGSVRLMRNSGNGQRLRGLPQSNCARPERFDVSAQPGPGDSTLRS